MHSMSCMFVCTACVAGITRSANNACTACTVCIASLACVACGVCIVNSLLQPELSKGMLPAPITSNHVGVYVGDF